MWAQNIFCKFGAGPKLSWSCAPTVLPDSLVDPWPRHLDTRTKSNLKLNTYIYIYSAIWSWIASTRHSKMKTAFQICLFESQICSIFLWWFFLWYYKKLSYFRVLLHFICLFSSIIFFISPNIIACHNFVQDDIIPNTVPILMHYSVFFH